MAQDKLQEVILKIDSAYKKMQSIKEISLSSIEKYMDEFSISASFNSNAIEGNTFTYDETRLLIKEGVTSNKRSFREHEEIIGYKTGFDFLLESKEKNRIIDENFIKELHSLVLRGHLEAGSFRKIQVYIGDMFNVTFTPCSASEVPKKILEYSKQVQEDLLHFTCNKDSNFDWLKLFHTLSKHHIEFERIHPFIDGNGRTGRLLLIYEMLMLGLLPIDIRLEERSKYNSAFKKYDRKLERSDNPNSKTQSMAQLLAESELRSMEAWNKMFLEFVADIEECQRL